MLTCGDPAMTAAATEGLRSLLTPTLPTSSAAAASAALLPSTSTLNSAAATKAASGAGHNTGKAAPAGVDSGVDPSVALSVEDVMAAMGRAFTPASTSALVELMVKGDPSISPLAAQLLPVSATDSACRTAIIGHAKYVGMGMWEGLVRASNL